MRNRTWWYFKLRREQNGLSDFNYAIRCRIVQEPVKMEDENRWKSLNLNLLAHIARAQLADLYGLWLRDVRNCVFNRVYRIGLREDFGG